MARKALPMKLLVDTKSNKVLFAEAGKDVVDFLFSLLGIPIGYIVKLLTKNRMVGCVGNLYHSLESLDLTYLQSNNRKAALLNPNVASSLAPSPAGNLLLPAKAVAAKRFYICKAIMSSCRNNYTDASGVRCPSCQVLMLEVTQYVDPNTYNVGKVNAGAGAGDVGYVKAVAAERLYICKSCSYANCWNYYTDASGVGCPSCHQWMSEVTTYVDPNPNKVEEVNAGDGDDGYVKGVVTYSIMDDLTVTPMSTISSITLLNKFHVTDVAALKEKTVNIGYEEGLELVKSSLQSKTVLTDVFLAKAQPQVFRKTMKPGADVR